MSQNNLAAQFVYWSVVGMKIKVRGEKKRVKERKKISSRSPIIAHPSTCAAHRDRMRCDASKNTIEGLNQTPKVATCVALVSRPLPCPSTLFVGTNNFSQFSFFFLFKSHPWIGKIQFCSWSFNYFKLKKLIIFF